jgi:hypothetical protein
MSLPTIYDHFATRAAELRRFAENIPYGHSSWQRLHRDLNQLEQTMAFHKPATKGKQQ